MSQTDDDTSTSQTDDNTSMSQTDDDTEWESEVPLYSSVINYHPLTYPCCFHSNEVGDSGI